MYKLDTPNKAIGKIFTIQCLIVYLTNPNTLCCSLSLMCTMNDNTFYRLYFMNIYSFLVFFSETE